MKKLFVNIGEHKMKQKTFNLYRSSPKRWKDLTYTKALKERIKAATEAMSYYRKEKNINSFMASEKALRFNEKLLEEIND